MATGTVKWFDPKKGFGFVVNDDGKDVFIHYTSIDGDGFRCLKNGETVEYDQLDSDKGLQGRNVRIADIMPKSIPAVQEAEV
jgi:CspA family cold shock protein